MTDEQRRPGCLDAHMLAEYIDGGLDPRERADVEAHLAECGECYEVFAETVKIVGEETAVMASASAAPATKARRWMGILATAAALALVASAMWWWMSPRQQLRRAVGQLAEASAAHGRLSSGRLSIDSGWAAAPTVSRGANTPATATDIRAAALTIERLTLDARTADALHARGLGALATGNVEDAARDLRAAADIASPDDVVTVRTDLAAVLLERSRRNADPEDLAAALDAAETALRLNKGYLPALFSRAVAIEAIGPRALAVTAWQTYLEHDPSSAWAAEARRRIDALRSPSSSLDFRVIDRLHDIEDRVLPAWSEAVISGRATDDDELARQVEALRADTQDGELRTLLGAAATTPDRRRTLAQVMAAHVAWRQHYAIGDMDRALLDAAAERAGLSKLQLSTTGADAATLLVSDRNATYDQMVILAERAEREGFLRAAALLRISYGNTSLRKQRWSTAVESFHTARRIALSAGDLELASTASAMLADGYRDLGETSRAWSALQQSLEGLPSVTNKRLVYSILRAVPQAAVEGDYPAASLAYSDLLITATQGWNHPGARLLAHIDRAAAFAAIGEQARAAAELDAADALVPQVSDVALRGEYDAEVALSRGTLAQAAAPRAAVDHLTRALMFYETRRTTSRIAAGLLARGRAYAQSGDKAAAERDWVRGAALVSDDRVEIRDEQLRISRLDSLWSIFATLTASELDRPDVALATVERARSRELLDTMASHQTLSPLIGDALWNWLPPGVTAIVYAALPDELAVWTLRAGGSALRRLPIGERALTQLVDRALPEVLGAGGPAASQLSAMLLGSLNGTAPEQLLLVLDGALHRVPFAALPYGVTGERLVQRTIPTVASSLGVARTLSSYRPIAGRALLVSDGRPKPLEALVALPGADSEVERLRHIYPDAVVLTNAAATPAAVMKAAETSAVIHITAHGIANAAHPNRSRIELADDGVEHELRPGNIAAAVLSKHPVVILSSCDTGAGRTFRGEGQMNLGRPFLAAGASAVVAAQWNLDDASAPAMVSAMHTRLRDGTPVAAAVAQVQRDAIQKGLPTQVWATFVVLGGAMPPRK